MAVAAWAHFVAFPCACTWHTVWQWQGIFFFISSCLVVIICHITLKSEAASSRNWCNSPFISSNLLSLQNRTKTLPLVRLLGSCVPLSPQQLSLNSFFWLQLMFWWQHTSREKDKDGGRLRRVIPKDSAYFCRLLFNTYIVFCKHFLDMHTQKRGLFQWNYSGWDSVTSGLPNTRRCVLTLEVHVCFFATPRQW